MSDGAKQKLYHESYGECHLLRTEGSDWVLHRVSTGRQFRIAPSQREGFVVMAPPPVTPKAAGKRVVAHPPILRGPDLELRDLRNAFDSMRGGLPPVDYGIRTFAIKSATLDKSISGFLKQVECGGAASVLRGSYGQGKTFSLMLLEETALSQNYCVMRTEIDAAEKPLSKPQNVYHALMKHLRLPGSKDGIMEFLRRVREKVQAHSPGEVTQSNVAMGVRNGLFREALDCRPLAWLLSDPNLINRPELISLLTCAPGIHVPSCRKRHVLDASPQIWPNFKHSTFGDFACYLLSGMSRASRMLGFKGLIVILDEMEKWENLNWLEQSRASNLLGGLLWAASARSPDRTLDKVPACLGDNHRSGSPFSTEQLAHIGVAIAMTPRGYRSPETTTWPAYGQFQVIDLPPISGEQLGDFCDRMVPLYARSRSKKEPSPLQIAEIRQQAVTKWQKENDHSVRAGVKSVVAALDEWAD